MTIPDFSNSGEALCYAMGCYDDVKVVNEMKLKLGYYKKSILTARELGVVDIPTEKRYSLLTEALNMAEGNSTTINFYIIPQVVLRKWISDLIGR